MARADIARLLAGAVMLSFSAPLARIAETPPTVSAFYRMLFGGVILLALVLIQRKRLWASARFFGVLLIVAFFFTLDLIFWHRSITYVGPGLATILGNFQVFILAVAGWLIYKERIRARFVVSLGFAFAGLWMLVGIDWAALPANYKFGVWMGLATAVVYSVYTLTLRHAQSQPHALPSQSTMAVASLLCAGMLAVSVVLEGESFAIPTVETGIALVAYGFFGQVLGWVLVATALPNVKASVAGLVLLLQPALSFTWDIIFFERPTGWIEAAGAVLTLVGIYLGTTARKRRRRRLSGVQ